MSYKEIFTDKDGTPVQRSICETRLLMLREMLNDPLFVDRQDWIREMIEWVKKDMKECEDCSKDEECLT